MALRICAEHSSSSRYSKLPAKTMAQISASQNSQMHTSLSPIANIKPIMNSSMILNSDVLVKYHIQTHPLAWRINEEKK